MPALTYRFATPADVPAVVALVESAYRGESSEQGWTSESHLIGGQRTDPAMIEDTLARPGSHVLLAEEDGVLRVCCELNAPSAGDPGAAIVAAIEGASDAGSACASAGAVAVAAGAAAADATMDAPDHGCGPGHSPSGTAYFGMFAVDPTLQGGGYGRQVLAEAERIARDDFGATAMEMTVIRQREALIAWYERRGYTQTGERRPFPYGDERFGLPKRDDLEMVVLAKTL